MSKKIIFYDGGCADCQQVATFLSANGIDYDRKNVKAHPELLDELKKKGTQALPVVMVGDKVLTGWNESELKKHLCAKG